MRSKRPLILGLVAVVVAAHVVAAYYLLARPAQSLLPSESLAPLGEAGFKLAQRIEKEPCNLALANDLAWKLIQARDYSAVLELYRGRVERCGPCDNLRASVFSANMGLANYQDAENIADALVADYPGDPSMRAWRSQAREKNGKIQGAYEDMLKALSLFPDPAKVSVQVYYDTAKLASKAGYPCEAANTLRDFVAFDARKRRTQQMDTLMKDWQREGACARLFADGSAKVRYSTREGAILVPVEVNGVQARMILDTGATMTLVTQDFAKRAGVDTAHQIGGVATTANGRTWVNGGRAETMTLGGASLKNVPLLVQGTAKASLGEGIDGLIGLSFLGNFQVRLNNGVLELAPIE